MTNETIQDYLYGEGQPEGATVREILVAAYGDDWERSINHIVGVTERSEMIFHTDASGFKGYNHEYYPVIVLNNTTGFDVHGYEDTVSIANYRVLKDNWSDLEGLTDGPYSGSSHISLDLDKAAPADLIATLEALESYPVLNDDEHNLVEQETIQEHWDSYGRSDTFDVVAKAIGGDSSLDLTDYAEELITKLVWDGILDYGYGGGYPYMIDPSACEFGSDEVAAWLRARLGLVVTIKTQNGYGPSETVPVLKANLLTS